MRIRIGYKKELPLRFTSALDIQGIWERSLRRSDLRISYSQGFHPQPKIQLGLPLPLGFISDDEQVDVWLQNEVEIEALATLISPNLPDGITIISVSDIELDLKPLVTTISNSEYTVKFWDTELNLISLQSRVENLLGQEEIIRIKRNSKQYNLRPLIHDLHVQSDPEHENEFPLFMSLTAKQNQMGRADEVMLALGYALNQFMIKRVKSY
jgi:radical SAM-linked protein